MKSQTPTSPTLVFSFFALALMMAGQLAVVRADGPDPAGLLGLLVPPDGSAIPNAASFLNCLQPGGDPGKSLITALPNPTILASIMTTPKLAFDMATMSCGELKNDAGKAANLVKQLLQGKITPQQFVQQLMQIDPKLNQLIKQIAEDALKTLQNIIPGIQNPLLKAVLQSAASMLQQAINNPQQMMQQAAAAAQAAYQSLPPQLQQMAGAAAGAAPGIADSIIKQLTGPPSG